MNIVAVVPARGGSKGIPRKNLAPLAGKPLIHYTLDVASRASCLSRVIVSTDDDEIADFAHRWPVGVVRRPRELGMDATPTLPVVVHALESCTWDAVMVLQPTNPLRTIEDIYVAAKMLEHTAAVLSVTPVEEYHPARMYRLSHQAGSQVAERLTGFADCRRQDLESLYLRDGSIYAAKRPLIQAGTLTGLRPAPLVIPRCRSVRIDTPEDLAYAEWLLTRQSKPA